MRRIFDCYLSGMGLNAIARMLQKDGVPTKHGGRWADKTVRQILSNEKYKGTLLLQKTFSLDHISKKKAVNKGALPQYLVENSHDAIVSPDTFDAVQRLIESKSNTASSQSDKKNAYTGKIVCEKCGKRFRRKITSGGIRWSCSTFETYGKAQCDARRIPETVLDEIIQGRPFKQIRVPQNGTLTVE